MKGRTFGSSGLSVSFEVVPHYYFSIINSNRTFSCCPILHLQKRISELQSRLNERTIEVTDLRNKLARTQNGGLPYTASLERSGIDFFRELQNICFLNRTAVTFFRERRWRKTQIANGIPQVNR